VKKLALFGILAVAGIATSANAFVVRSQWVFRVGPGADSTFAPVPAGGIDATTGTAYRLRLQFGVFDDAAGPAPAGGYIGWNLGTLTATGGTNTRTNGRLAPFNFAPNPPGNGLPSADPFTALTAIDNTLGTQGTGSPGFPAWVCTAPPNQVPNPPPAFIARGINAFLSTFEITTVAGTSSYSITAGGNNVVASSWGTIGTPTPPDCGDPSDPSDDIPGSILYAPMTLPPITGLNAVAQLNIIPAPGAAALLGLGGLVALRRRRA
jgi:uncharacterized protein (TIGR03382 family)